MSGHIDLFYSEKILLEFQLSANHQLWDLI